MASTLGLSQGSRAKRAKFDADGSALCTEILKIIGCCPGVEHAVLCLDAPLECEARPGQPPRRKAVTKGECTGSKQRGAEFKLREHMSQLDRMIAGAWNKDLRIQAGSPIPPRISSILDLLGRSTMSDLTPYRAKSASSPRGIVEVFPSEAIWALGQLKAYNEDDSSAVRGYKAKKPRRVSIQDAQASARRPLQGFLAPLRSGGFPDEIAITWIDQIVNESVQLLSTTASGDVLKSKAFDDLIDSGIAFLTAVTCALGQFHEWGDGTDGTIVGPGRLNLPEAQ